MTVLQTIPILIGIFVQFSTNLRKSNLSTKLILTFFLWSFFTIRFFPDNLFPILIFIPAFSIFVIYHHLKLNAEKITLLLSPPMILLILSSFWTQQILTYRSMHLSEDFVPIVSGAVVTLIAIFIYLSYMGTLQNAMEITIYIWLCLVIFFSITQNVSIKDSNILNLYSLGSLTTFAVIGLANLLLFVPFHSTQSQSVDIDAELKRATMYRRLINLSFLDINISKTNFVLLVLSILVVVVSRIYLQMDYLSNLLLALYLGYFLFVPNKVKEVT